MRLAVALAVLAAVLAVVAATIASCSGRPHRLAYPQFQRAAAGICLRYRHRLARLGAPASLPRIGRVARGAYRLGKAERSALEGLEPPRDAAGGYARMLERLARADAILPALWRAAEAGDADSARRLVRTGRSLVIQANVHAVAIGLPDCRRG